MKLFSQLDWFLWNVRIKEGPILWRKILLKIFSYYRGWDILIHYSEVQSLIFFLFTHLLPDSSPLIYPRWLYIRCNGSCYQHSVNELSLTWCPRIYLFPSCATKFQYFFAGFMFYLASVANANIVLDAVTALLQTNDKLLIGLTLLVRMFKRGSGNGVVDADNLFRRKQ